jgi:hypothetical protein
MLPVVNTPVPTPEAVTKATLSVYPNSSDFLNIHADSNLPQHVLGASVQCVSLGHSGRISDHVLELRQFGITTLLLHGRRTLEHAAGRNLNNFSSSSLVVEHGIESFTRTYAGNLEPARAQLPINWTYFSSLFTVAVSRAHRSTKHGLSSLQRPYFTIRRITPINCAYFGEQPC